MEKRDVYYYVDYCRLYQMLGHGDPYLFVYKEDGTNHKVIYPFLKRKIKSGMYDISTPFGYGGPLANSTNPGFIKKFRSAFHQYCVKEKIVSEFIRFHPLMESEGLYQSFLNVKFAREMVIMDLTKEPDEIFHNIGKSNRNKIRKARKAGLTFRVIDAPEAAHHLEQFITLYYETMDRNNASPFYYFPKPYFEHMLINLSEQVKMAAVFDAGKMVAADLILCEGHYMNDYLNAGDRNYFRLGSNPLLIYETALWGKRHGFKHFDLGGSYEKADSLFKFKLRFNPTGIVNYYTGTMVHNQSIYRELVYLWKKKNAREPSPDFFPLYRQ